MMAQMKKLNYKLQRGFSLVTAIFLLVVLAALGAVMVTFSTAQQQSFAIDVLGSRAYQAARAGIEWSAYQVLKGGGCVTGVVTMPTPGPLSDFTVNVACSTTVQSDVTPATADTTRDIGTVTVYSVSSVATAGTLGQADYVERQLTVSIAQ